jgi:hypothetical protein
MKEAKTFKLQYLLQAWWLLLIVAAVRFLPEMAYA